MRYFAILALEPLLLLWPLSFNLIRSENTQAKLPNISLIAGFIERYVKPYIESFNLASHNPVQRSFDVMPERKAIKQKVAELKPLLQDDDHIINTDDNLRLDGNDKTTIIEFKPKNSPKNVFREGNVMKTELFKNNVNKYKIARDKIKKAFNEESVSDKTKNLVTQTFDGIISQFLSGQCSLRSGDSTEIEARKDYKLDSLLHTLEVTAIEWEKFKRKYLKEARNGDFKQSLFLFDQFYNVVLSVINDTQTLLHEYKVKCHVVDGMEHDPKDLRVGVQVTDSKNTCAHFRLCSGELKQFLADFYKSLNETAVMVFKNYAAMYGKDVNTNDGGEKKVVISVIDKISDAVELNVSKIFRKETMRIELDERKEINANVQNIKRYIKTSINHVKNHIKNHLGANLQTLRARLLHAVEQDIIANLEVELQNLERDFTERICISFSNCNRNISKSQRKMFDPRTDVLNTNHLYVKVQITMDDELKDAMVKTHRALFPSRRSKNDTFAIYHTAKPRVDVQKYSNIHVTRTTFNVYNKSEMSTTEMNSALKKGKSYNSTVKEEDLLNEI